MDSSDTLQNTVFYLDQSSDDPILHLPPLPSQTIILVALKTQF